MAGVLGRRGEYREGGGSEDKQEFCQDKVNMNRGFVKRRKLRQCPTYNKVIHHPSGLVVRCKLLLLEFCFVPDVRRAATCSYTCVRVCVCVCVCACMRMCSLFVWS